MGSIAELGSLGFGEPKVPLVHQGRRIEQNATAPGAQACPGELAQVTVRRGHELIGRGGIAPLRSTDQIREVPPLGHPEIYST
jgi:hypothetical protein